jgi:4-amino-4-deoxy-L-arabinose transferase-like glycosyltransferase
MFLLSLAIHRDYGITWDEEIQQQYGEGLIRYYASFGQDESLFGIRNMRHYGGFFELLAALAARFTPDSVYETRHLVNAAFGALAVVAACRIGTRLGGLACGALAAALLASTPLFFGHLFNNPKDMPFAAAVALSLAAFLGGWEELPRLSRRRVLLAGGAAGVALGIRPAALPVLAVFWIGLLGCWLLARRGAANAIRPLLLSTLKLAALAWLLMLLFWPWGLLHPFEASVDAFPLATGINRRGQVLFDGQVVSSRDLPWSYVPLWLLASLPEFLMVCLVAGAVIAMVRRRASDDTSWKLAWLAATVLLPIAAAVVLKPSLYDGVRHFVFVLPSLAVLAALGAMAVVRSSLALPLRLSFAALVAGLAVVTLRDMVRLHPYQSIYFNRVLAGGVAQAGSRFETDYWCASYKEAAEWLVERYGFGLERKVRVASLYVPLGVNYYLLKTPAGQGRFLPVSLEDNPHVLIATTRWSAWAKYPGRVLHRVERDGAALSYVIEMKAPQPFFAKRPKPGDPRIAGAPGAGARHP